VSPFLLSFLPQPRVSSVANSRRSDAQTSLWFLSNLERLTSDFCICPSRAPRSANISPDLSTLRILSVATGVWSPPAFLATRLPRAFFAKGHSSLATSRRPFVFNGLRTLKLSCSYFSHSDRLFSIACALFDKMRSLHPGCLCGNTGSGIPRPALRRLRALCASAVKEIPRPALGFAQFWCNINSFRINTCKSVAKQTTSSPFRMNTCEKPGGGGHYC
jgi:hypothetical protein